MVEHLMDPGPQNRRSDEVLRRLRSAVEKIYGARIERIMLYGSRARGDEEPDSDYDVAVFLYDLTERASEVRLLAEIQTDIIDATGAFVHVTPYPAGAWAELTPLMLNIRAEGRDL